MESPAHLTVELETARLKLRGHRIDDFESAFAMWSEPLVTRFIGGKPSTEQQTWSRMLGYVGHWRLMGFGYWAVEEKSTGTFVGEVGFANFRRGISHDLDDVPELGWAFAAPYHGRGYATEALGAAIAWGDLHFAKSRTFCLINEENLASIRLANKCGYAEFERATFNGIPTLFFDRERP